MLQSVLHEILDLNSNRIIQQINATTAAYYRKIAIVRALGKIKHFHLIWWEGVSASQDGAPVFYTTWNVVGVAKLSVWTSVLICITLNRDVVPPAKCRTVKTVLVNCVSWVFHHALERSQIFFVVKRKNERIGSGTVATRGVWKKKKPEECDEY